MFPNSDSALPFLHYICRTSDENGRREFGSEHTGDGLVRSFWLYQSVLPKGETRYIISTFYSEQDGLSFLTPVLKNVREKGGIIFIFSAIVNWCNILGDSGALWESLGFFSAEYIFKRGLTFLCETWICRMNCSTVTMWHWLVFNSKPH